MVFRAGQRDPCILDVARFLESVKLRSPRFHPAWKNHAIVHGEPFGIRLRIEQNIEEKEKKRNEMKQN